MFDGSNPCWVPTVPISVDNKWRLKIAQFGDGYEQRTLDGINALDLTWSLQWQNRPPDDLVAMDAYLEAERASGFVFRHPVTGTLYTVFCDEWKIDWSPSRRQHGLWVYYGTMSANFRKANGVAV